MNGSVVPPYTYVTSAGAVDWKNGSIDADGNVEFPAAGQNWPGLTGLYAATVSTLTPGRITGTVDQASGQMDLTFPYSMRLDSSLMGTCTMNGTATLTTDGTEIHSAATEHPVAGSNWNQATGAFTAVTAVNNPVALEPPGSQACDFYRQASPSLEADGLGWVLSGTLEVPQEPSFAASPDPVTFPAQEVNTSSSTQSVTVTNTGGGGLAFVPGGISLAGANPGQYAIVADTCSGQTIAASASCQVGLQFRPTGVGAKPAEVVFSDNAGDSPQSVPLTGSGVLPPAPTASVTPASGQFLTGDEVTFTAAGSTGSVAGYEWSVDGSGFQPGGDQLQQSWTTPGDKSVVVRVNGPGGSSTATAAVQVLAKGRGVPGISIDGGAPYTRTKAVTIDVQGWPNGATEIQVSNDGGFKNASLFPVAERIPWTLDDSVPGAFTKVVYVRFRGFGMGESRTYSDDIIFDNTPPKVLSATATPTGSTAALTGSALAKRTSSWKIKSKAKDPISGVAVIQANDKKKAGGATTRSYRSAVTVKLPRSAKKVFIRVQDGAGNWSKWTKATVK